MKRGFGSGDLNKDCMKKANKTYFIVNLKNGKSLDTIGDKVGKYKDVIYGVELIKMVLRMKAPFHLSRNSINLICSTMIIFEKNSRSYLINGVMEHIMLGV